MIRYLYIYITNYYSNEFKKYSKDYHQLQTNATQYQTIAIKYLIAICRIYITDYLCADYELPSNCRFIMDEIQYLHREYHILSHINEKTFIYKLIMMIFISIVSILVFMYLY